MKIILTSLLLSLTGFASHATNVADGTDPTSISKALKQQLNKHMVSPVFHDHDMTGTVQADFVLDKNGKVKIINLESQNNALKAYVERKLLKIKVSGNTDGFWKTTSLSFVFRKER